MHSFHYQNGRLHCEDVDLKALAAEHGTPLYVYSAGTILDHYRRLDEALAGLDHQIQFAVKANSNIGVLNLLSREGCGFDIVSGGELFRVLKAGGNPGRCSFAGVGKTRDEIAYALEHGIYSFNVESEAELAAIDTVAGQMGTTAPVALRVNPNVDARTHKYISTGLSENKFGIEHDTIPDVCRRAAALPHVRLRGIQMHIGSQLTSIDPFVQAVTKMTPLVESLRDDHDIEFFSVGGGLGIVYEDSLASGRRDWWAARSQGGASPATVNDYADALVSLLAPLGLKILLEPGRLIVGNAGVLLSEVLYEKTGEVKTFRIVDAGMNDLIRPALYQGHHEIVPVDEPASPEARAVDVVGPICETGDFFAQNRELPALQAGDVIALMSAGAYGFVMASNYNSRPFPAEILVSGGQSHVIRERQSHEDLVRGESIPGQAALKSPPSLSP